MGVHLQIDDNDIPINAVVSGPGGGLVEGAVLTVPTVVPCG